MNTFYPKSVISATRRMRKIFDAKYEKADLNKVMNEQWQHLKTEESEQLLILFNKHEGLFGGTLGMWNTNPVNLELRENAKPVCLRTYPVPRVHESMFRK